MLSALACLASFFPMFPSPTIPRYFPESSVPISSFFNHLPFRISLSARGISLASESINPKTSSATAFIAPSTAFITRIPFAFAASTSMLSRPTPTRAIILHFDALSIISFVIFVLLLTMTISKFPIFSLICSGEISGSYDIFSPFFCSMSFKIGATWSQIKTDWFIDMEGNHQV